MLRPACSLLIALAISACAVEPIIPTRHADTMRVTMHELAPDKLVAFCASVGLPSRRACTLSYPDSGRCDIYVPEARYMDDAATAIVGHETLHCFLGKYHHGDG